MRISRKLLNLRFLIYAGLIAYFGYEAVERYRGAAAEESSQPTVNAGGEQLQPTRMQLLPDGTKVPIYEITPEQAKHLLGASPKDVGEKAPPQPSSAAPEQPKTGTPD